MKINYADRRNDKNIIKKQFVMIDSDNADFKGKLGLISLEEVNQKFIAKRPNGNSETVIDNGFKILTFFPENGAYCCTVMINRENQILQWYFDILKSNCNYDFGVPFGEDMFLDVILLPNGEFYMIDEDDLSEALQNNLITREEFEKAYTQAREVEEIAKNKFDGLNRFTKDALNKMQSLL